MNIKRYGQVLYASVGDISKSRAWASLEIRPWARNLALHFGKTYNGTRTGFVFMLGPVIAISHIR